MRGLTFEEVVSRKLPHSVLTPLRIEGYTDSGKRAVVCLCICGEETLIATNSFYSAISCGCLIHYSIEEINKLKPSDSRLTAIEFLSTKKGKRVLCQCSCGKTCIVATYRVVSGHTMSCSCYNKEITRKRSQKYFPVVKPIYRSYKAMWRRCYDPKVREHKYYGAKGVKMCGEWKNNYQSFLDWSLANGWREGLEIDKDIIPQKLGIPALLYSPDMCTWVTPEENKEYMNKKYDFEGLKMRLNEIAKLIDIPANVLSMRMSSRGRTLQEAIAMGKKSGKSGLTKYFDYKGEKRSLMAIATLEGIRYGNLRRDVNDLNISIYQAVEKRKNNSRL